MNKNLLTVKEAANRLNMKPRTLRTWIYKDKIKYYKINNWTIRIPESALEEIIEQK